MFRFLSALPVFLILVACGPQKGNETVVINDLYSMEIPNALNPTTDLNEDASLQYQNVFKELYVIVIDETASEFKDALVENGIDSLYTNDLYGYSDLLMTGVNMELGNGRSPEFVDKNINGLEARVVDLDAVYDGLDIFYKFAFFQGKEHYYQIMTWCLAERKYVHQQDMDDMINSFREL